MAGSRTQELFVSGRLCLFGELRRGVRDGGPISVCPSVCVPKRTWHLMLPV